MNKAPASIMSNTDDILFSDMKGSQHCKSAKRVVIVTAGHKPLSYPWRAMNHLLRSINISSAYINSLTTPADYLSRPSTYVLRRSSKYYAVLDNFVAPLIYL